MEQDAITLENIYTLLANFDIIFDKFSDEEKKSLISSLIKEIEIFPCDESELPLKSISFNFPIYKDGGDVCDFCGTKELPSQRGWRGQNECHLIMSVLGNISTAFFTLSVDGNISIGFAVF